MDYSSKHFVFKSSDIKSKNVSNTVKQILLRKGDKWAAEQEYRFIFDILENREDVDKADGKSPIVWYDHHDNPIIRLDDSAIQSMHFGSRVPKNNICQIKDILKFIKRPEINLYQCKLNKEKYSLDIVPLSTQ